MWMPDDFYTQDQWKMIERAIYFVKQFYIGTVTHREFVTTSYLPDQTTLHGDLYNKLWVPDDFFMYFVRIPFVSVRGWTIGLGYLALAKKHAAS